VRLRRLALFALAFLPGRVLRAQQAEVAGAAVPADSISRDGRGTRQLFRVGERLRYDIRWGFYELGTAEMSVVGIDTIRGTPAAHVQFRIVGGNFFYRMDDRMDSWVALHDTSSRRFTQDFNENKKERHAWYEILPDSGYYREKEGKETHTTVAKPLDDAAFFYFVRTMKLEAKKKYELDRYFRPDRNPVVLDVKSVDTLDVPAGKFPSIVLQPIIKGGGILKETSQARMWLSDDDRHYMVQLKSKFPVVGVLTMRLIGIDSLPGTTKPAKK
jgi:hypothetical protein